MLCFVLLIKKGALKKLTCRVARSLKLRTDGVFNWKSLKNAIFFFFFFFFRYGDHYRWNKVTTCVHNILGGQRWVDQFGEMTITNGSILCKLTFPKASHYYQSDKRHEVYGSILNPEGKIVHNIFGLWNEALYCGQSATARCIWRPGEWNLTLSCWTWICSALANSVDPDQLASKEANWSGSTLFAIQYVNLYQQLGSSNMLAEK